MSSLVTVKRALEGRSGRTAAGSRADEKQAQDKARGDIRRTGLNGEPGSRWELTRRGLLDRLGLNSNAYRVEGLLGDGGGNVSIGFGSAYDQVYPDCDALR